MNRITCYSTTPRPPQILTWWDARYTSSCYPPWYEIEPSHLTLEEEAVGTTLSAHHSYVYISIAEKLWQWFLFLINNLRSFSLKNTDTKKSRKKRNTRGNLKCKKKKKMNESRGWENDIAREKVATDKTHAKWAAIYYETKNILLWSRLSLVNWAMTRLNKLPFAHTQSRNIYNERVCNTLCH